MKQQQQQQQQQQKHQQKQQQQQQQHQQQQHQHQQTLRYIKCSVLLTNVFDVNWTTFAFPCHFFCRPHILGNSDDSNLVRWQNEMVSA